MSAVHVALRKRYPAPAWAYFEEVRNGTGYARSTVRTADALAFSLYPSNGLELHGFEVKVSRGDWLRERDDPEKAAAIGQFCERWSLATATGVINDVSEVPPAWGWLELRGKALVQKKAPPLREAKPLDKLMVASILRNASEVGNARIAEAVLAQVGERMEAERTVAREAQDKLVARCETADQRCGRAEHRLEEVAAMLGADLAPTRWERDRAWPPLAADVTARLAVLAQRDLEEVKREMMKAATNLRQAASVARRLITQAGGRPTKLKARRDW